MATPETLEISQEPQTDDAGEFNCETPGCANSYRFISLFVGDSQAHFHCAACWLAWNAAIAKGLFGEPQPETPGA